MTSGLRITVTDPDPDYLGIEILASSGRFSGAAKIYAGLDELSKFAEVITGFPTGWKDERKYVFGTKDKGIAGGYCALRFYCRDGSGHSIVDVEFEDDDRYYYSEASARFTFPVLPAELDQFVEQLRSVERAQSGEARLESRG
jgi:hypothetical protein